MYLAVLASWRTTAAKLAMGCTAEGTTESDLQKLVTDQSNPAGVQSMCQQLWRNLTCLKKAGVTRDCKIPAPVARAQKADVLFPDWMVKEDTLNLVGHFDFLAAVRDTI